MNPFRKQIFVKFIYCKNTIFNSAAEIVSKKIEMHDTDDAALNGFICKAIFVWEVSVPKFLKIFLRKVLNLHYFRIVFSEFNKTRGHFARFDEKPNLQKICEKIFENFQKFSSENCENALF